MTQEQREAIDELLVGYLDAPPDELHGLEKSSTVAMYFDPKTKAPITLLELGLHASKNGLIVCCPEGFWRKGNVDIVCENYGIETAIDLNDLIQKIRIRNG